MEPIIQFLINNILEPFTTAIFTVIGGGIPIAFLIYIFSKKEKVRLLAHAKLFEDALPLQEKLLKEIQENLTKSISRENVSDNLDQFRKIMENYQLLEDNKKFIKYAKNYNFISAVGHVLRASNYMPRSVSEHKEISKNLPSSSSSDT